MVQEITILCKHMCKLEYIYSEEQVQVFQL